MTYSLLYILALLCQTPAKDDPAKKPPEQSPTQKEATKEQTKSVPMEAKPQLPELAKELVEMVELDQKLRTELVEGQKTGSKPEQEKLKKLMEVDQKHTARMREIVKKHGWPGRSLVGSAGAGNAWLLVQHADMSPDFQKQCLALMEAMPKGEVEPRHLAYLTDRVLCGEKKKQRYGTQLMEKDGKLVPQPIEDEANVDKRRQEVGLGTLEKYLKQAGETFKEKK